MAGAYYRNGPGRFDLGDSTEKEFFAHPFDGDGYILKVYLSDIKENNVKGTGRRIEVVSKYIKTEGYLNETEQQKILYRNTFGTQRKGGIINNAFDLQQKNVANTGLIFWGSGKTLNDASEVDKEDDRPIQSGGGPKLLALWEASQPYALDPVSLDTIGTADLNGILRIGMPFATGLSQIDDILNKNAGLAGDPLTAHPHVDAKNSRLVTFGYQVSPDMKAINSSLLPLMTTFTFYEFDASFGLTSKIEYELSKFAFVHDFCFTENYYIVFQNPVDLDMFPFIIGAKCPGECLQFNQSEKTKIHVLPRPGSNLPSKKRMEFEVDACFVFHHANAYEDDNGKIHVDSVRLPEMVDFASVGGVGGGSPKPSGSGSNPFLNVDFTQIPVNQLYRFSMDLASGEAESRELSAQVVEFPTINPNLFSKEHRYIFVGAASHPTRNQPLQSWVKYDMKTGKQVTYAPGNRFYAGECEFVPKKNISESSEASEDDGYLVGLFYNSCTAFSELHIVDAISMTNLAVVKLKHHVPYGLHGCFVQEEELRAVP